MLVVEMSGAAFRSSRFFLVSQQLARLGVRYAANVDQDTVAIVGSQAACVFVVRQSTSIVRCTIDVEGEAHS